MRTRNTPRTFRTFRSTLKTRRTPGTIKAASQGLRASIDMRKSVIAGSVLSRPLPVPRSFSILDPFGGVGQTERVARRMRLGPGPRWPLSAYLVRFESLPAPGADIVVLALDLFGRPLPDFPTKS